MNLTEVYMYMNLQFGDVFIVKPKKAIPPAEIRAKLGRKYHLTKGDMKVLLKKMQKKGMIKIFRNRVRIL